MLEHHATPHQRVHSMAKYGAMVVLRQPGGERWTPEHMHEYQKTKFWEAVLIPNTEQSLLALGPLRSDGSPAAA